MQNYPSAQSCWRLTSLAFALVTLAACSSAPRQAVRDQATPIPVAIIKPAPEELLEDCSPAPLAGTKVADVLARTDSVEECLARLRRHLERLRAIGVAAASHGAQATSNSIPK